MLDILWSGQDQCLSLDELSYSASDLSLHISTTAPDARCPVCQLPSSNIHSHYQRALCDLPVAGLAVRIQLRVRRFFCRSSDCPRRIFVERLSALTRPYAHRTTRMSAALRRIGLALGGEAGGRLAAHLQLSGSADTILRFVRQTPDEPIASAPRVLGIDDFCFRKGQTYGTILVDLETHRVVDLLADRQATTVAAWPQQHPGVQIISRDRAGAYAEGARLGAPDAVQVADRFHLLQNLGDALEEILVRLYPELRQLMQTSESEPPGMVPMIPTTATLAMATATATANANASPDLDPAQVPPVLAEPQVRPRRHDVVLSDARRQTRQNRYDELQRLYELGWSKIAIGRKVGLSRDTVARWVQSQGLPEQQPRSHRMSKLDPHKSFLRERWEQGTRNAKLLWQELRVRGYQGCYSVVAEYTARLRQEYGIPLRRGAYADRYEVKQTSLARPRALRWLLWKPVDELTDAEYETVMLLCHNSKEVTIAYGLVTDFRELVRRREGEQLANWIELVKASGVAELVSFARGVLRDFAAVAAGMTLEWSQGAVEGNVNRLKMLKRQSYGRAKLDLLRLRVLHTS